MIFITYIFSLNIIHLIYILVVSIRFQLHYIIVFSYVFIWYILINNISSLLLYYLSALIMISPRLRHTILLLKPNHYYLQSSLFSISTISVRQIYMFSSFMCTRVIYSHMFTHTHPHTYTHIYTHTYTHTHTHTNTHTHTHKHTHIYFTTYLPFV